jgi:hypothetical protein
MTGEDRSTRKTTCPSTTLSTINPTSTDLGSNPGLYGDRRAIKCLNLGAVHRDGNDINVMQRMEGKVK